MQLNSFSLNIANRQPTKYIKKLFKYNFYMISYFKMKAYYSIISCERIIEGCR